MVLGSFEVLSKSEHERAIDALKDAYSLLLKINPADRLRFDNQSTYARCLMAIAEWEDRDEEQVQDEYEAANPGQDR